ncbi:MAG: hypothetical protein Q8O31_07835 [Rhodocyclaceae bacterium]|nr:hypothetical protein [Rhodocyclaceae bacterium]
MDRRRFLEAGFALTPLAAFLSACGKSVKWPEGMKPIMWDRDICVTCNMVISDPRFAGEMRGGPKDTVFKFDDPGCVALWLDDKAAAYPWMKESATKLWMASANITNGKPDASADVVWLDGFKAHYLTKTSPMGFNFGAVAEPQDKSVDFSTMCNHVVTQFKKGRA